MPRKSEREKRLKSKDIPILGDAAKKYERKQALKALEKARKLEKERLADGWHWLMEGKTKKLIKK